MTDTRSVRFSEDISRAIKWVQKQSGGDASDAIRRLVQKGLEREMADLYTQGRVTLREAAEVLALPLLDVLDVLRRHGVSGNITMEQALDACWTSEVLAKPPKKAVPKKKRQAR